VRREHSARRARGWRRRAQCARTRNGKSVHRRVVELYHRYVVTNFHGDGSHLATRRAASLELTWAGGVWWYRGASVRSEQGIE
jgi:hypothetical protein